VYQEFIRKVVKPIKDSQAQGGFRFTRVMFLVMFLIMYFITHFVQAGKEESEVFWPQLCIVVNDNPEGQLLAGIFDGATAEFPCRVCW
jgi:hypothetical protein